MTVEVDGVTYTAGDGNLTLVGTSWTLNIPAGNEITPDGTYDVTATVTDAAGNFTSDGTSGELIIDTTPPATPTVVSQTTSDTTPTITGTATVGTGETLTVEVDGVTYTAGDGNLTLVGTSWTLNIPAGNEITPDGTYDVTATVTDAAGNFTSDGTSGELIIDTTPPATPTVVSQTTSDTTPTITGTATVGTGETLTVEVDGVTYTAGDGNLTLVGTSWTLNIPAGNEITPDGTYDVTATVTDAAGNFTSDGTSGELIIDTTPPATPTVVSQTTSDTTPTITGTATVGTGETLTVEVDGVTYTAGDGNLTLVGTSWTLNIPAGNEITPDGTYDVTATVTDAAGNFTSDGTSGELIIDTTPPATPTVVSQTTSDTTPTITGTATVGTGETLTVEVDGVTYTAGDGNLTLVGTSWTLNIPAGNEITPDGTYDVTATVTDAAGNFTSDGTSGELIIDTTPPATPTVVSQTTSDTTPTITGTATVGTGETLTVEVDGVTYTAGDGNLTLVGTSWTLNIPAGNEITPDGTYDVTATVTDAAGNFTSDGTSGELIIDTTPPATPTVVSQTTSDTTPTITGTATVGTGETLTVEVDGVTYTAGDGNLTLVGTSWTLNIPAGNEITPDGTYDVTATVTDAAGNFTSDGTSGELIIDTTPPATPTVVSQTTSDTTPTITGTATVGTGETLTVEVDGVTYTAGDGNLTLVGTSWTLNIPAGNEITPDGTYDVTATVTDAAGNFTSDGTSGELIIDTTPPATPTVVSQTTSDTTPTITGTATVGTGETLTVEVDGVTYTAGDGNLTLVGTSWTLNIPAGNEITPDGTYDVTATVTDAAGNFTSDGTSGELIIDTTPPATPTVVSQTTSDTTPTITGTATVGTGETLTVEVDGVTYTAGDGNLTLVGTSWTLNIPAGNEITPDGTYDVTATVTDAAGNFTSDGTSGELIIDTTPPATPTVVSQTTSDTTPTITGTATVGTGETLTVEVDGVTYTAGDGNLTLVGTSWTLNIPAGNEITPDGTYDVTATVTDAAGNFTSDGTSGELIIDTTPPATPTVVSQTTSDTTPTITGTATVGTGETLTVEVDGVTYTAGDGNLTLVGTSWTLNIPAGNEITPDGTYDVTATVTDAAGNFTSDGTSGELIIDTTPPATPTVVSQTTSDTTPTITGTATVGTGETLTVEVDGVTYTAGDGNLTLVGTSWTLNIPAGNEITPDGTYDVTATVTDAAGNFTSDGTSGELIIDTTPPATPTVVSQTTSDTTPTITGTATVGTGETLTVEVDGVTYTAGDGNLTLVGTSWTLNIPAGNEITPDGTYDVTATVTDAAGNFTSDGTSGELIIDTTPPATPTVVSQTTSDTTPTITGTATVGTGETLTVEVDGVTYTAGDGNLTLVGTSWTLNIPAGNEITPDGTYDVTATVTDAAGNFTSDGTSGELIIDTTPPATPTVVSQTTSDTTPTITGTATVGTGETLTVEVDGVTYTAGDGNLTLVGTSWTLNIPAGNEITPDGTYDVTATVTDAAGNFTSDGTSGELIIDTTPPATPTVVSQTTSDTTPTITGTATVGTGETLTVEVDGVTYTAGDGNLTLVGTSWTLNIPAGNEITPDGTYDVTATVTDAAGNFTSDGTSGELIIDTTPPATPTVVSQTTSDTTPTITGTATVGTGETLTVEVDGVTYTAGDGNLTLVGTSWTLNIPAGNEITPDGTYDVTATVTDAAGNFTSDGTSGELIIDTTPPATPTVVSQTTSDTTPTITGTATVGTGETLTVEVDGVTYTAGDGNLTLVGTSWTLNIPAGNEITPDGTYDVTATVTDAAGNFTSDGTSGELIIDTTPPATPTVVSQTTSDTTPTITGTATVGTGETLTVEVDGVTYTAGDGNLTLVGTSWTLNIPAGNEITPDGTYDVTATVTDAAGNFTSDGTSGELIIDTTPPATPTVVSQTTSDTTPTITGTATVGTGETLTVEVDGVTYTAGDGNLTLVGTSWTLNIPAGNEITPDGTYDVTATVTDAAGNFTSDGTSGELIIDTVDPAVPTANTFTSTDGLPTLTGTWAEGDATVLTVTVDGVTYTLGTDSELTTDGSGNWTLDLSGLGTPIADGQYDVSVTNTDAAGNSSSDATNNELTVDTTAPAVPTANTFTSTDGLPTLTGTWAEGDATVLTVTVDGVTYTLGTDPELTTDGSGNWTLDLSGLGTPIADGQYDVSVTNTDAAGNSSSDATNNELIVIVNLDSDNDGIPDVDEDIDGDGDPTNDDSDGDGIPDYLDTDDDGDGVPTADEDIDGDGDPTNDDSDGDGIPDYLDTDDDGDGIPTADEDIDGDGDPTNDDSDGDGIPDYLDTDDDGDGVPTADEDIDGDGDPTNDDSDGDGIPDYLDTDDDGDGISTTDEDIDGDGDPTNDDSDGDGIPDYLDDEVNMDIPEGFSPNGDGMNDFWKIDGIENYPNNIVRVFNRWGNIVFEVRGYDNQSRKWTSQSNVGLIIGARQVPDGTYFYVIDLGNGGKPISGYIIVNR